jgi:D-alanyl-D-alanine carboxypeptidase (penicillin-binding protein 5/6)
MKKFAISIFLSLILVFSTLFAPMATAYTLPPDLEIHAKSVYMVNVETGTVVYEKDPTISVYPASVTKLMTALVALEQCPDLNRTVIVYPQVVDDLLGTGAAVTGLLPGEQVTMNQLLQMLLIPSACDAANAIAMEVCNSVEEFVVLMNQKAAALGMENTVYANAHGLHEDHQVTTAYDQYLLAQEVLKHKELTDICSQYVCELPATNYHEARSFPTTNYMINPTSSWYYKRVQGLKTGYTDNAGRNLVSLAEKDGQRYITVVMGTPADTLNGYQVHHEFDNTYELLYWAYTDLSYQNVVNTNKPIAEVKVKLCKETDHVIAVPAQEFHAIVPNESLDSVIFEPHLDKEELEAPIEKGAVLGTATVKCAGEEIGTIQLVAQQECKRNGFLWLTNRLVKLITHPITLTILALLLLAAIVFIAWNVQDNRRRRRLWNSKVRNR